ncbi:MAG TPA: tripartite tricarboxylate transporter substrate binding protein [Burkholderiales bacterium]|nr:tripartite tricarboxylate transporter substrate binding protein [Burkholderiales bacterium]
MTFRKLLVGALLALPLPLIAADAQKSSSFPQRPVRLLVPYAPGGATDIIARQLATKLNEAWGVGVVVDNRAGASGNIALEVAAKAAPDGYTLMVGNVSTNAINETTFAKTLSIRPSRDLMGVTNLIELPHVYAVPPSLPVANLKELVDYTRKSGGKLNYGSAGLGTYPHLDVARFLKAAHIEMTHVPYKSGGAGMLTGILQNEVQLVMINLASSISQIRAGRMKALATTWPTRRPELPDVPTMAESGYAGFGTNAWNGLFAPAKLPKPLLMQIHATVVKTMEAQDMKDTLAKSLMSVVTSKSPAEYQYFIDDEVKKWSRVVVDNDIRVE